jgi:hypothetical protein
LLGWLFGQCHTDDTDERHLMRRLVRVEHRVEAERAFPIATFVRRER